MTIKLFRPTFAVDECLAELREVLESGWTAPGPKTAEFERAWCDETELPHSCFLNSATAGLHLALHLLKRRGGWPDGIGVITTPLTFVSTNHAILYEKLRPVFCDVDEHLCLDPDAVIELLDSDPDIAAIMFVGYAGSVGQLGRIRDICRERGLCLILDAAHMAGTLNEVGCHVGAGIDATVFSFQAVKNLPTADSGMLCMDDPELDALARQLAWMGIDKSTFRRSKSDYEWRYLVEQVGWKYHGNDVMAALGLVGLRHLDRHNARRREIASIYDARLPGNIRVPIPECVPSRHLYPVLVDNRDEVRVELAKRGIQTGVHYLLNTMYVPYVPYNLGGIHNAVAACERLLSLPMHVKLTDDDAKFVADTLRELVL